MITLQFILETSRDAAIHDEDWTPDPVPVNSDFSFPFRQIYPPTNKSMPLEYFRYPAGKLLHLTSDLAMTPGRVWAEIALAEGWWPKNAADSWKCDLPINSPDRDPIYCKRIGIYTHKGYGVNIEEELAKRFLSITTSGAFKRMSKADQHLATMMAIQGDEIGQ